MRKKNKRKKKHEAKFKSWCKNFLWAFSISALIYITWKLVDFFSKSGCNLLDKCTLTTFSLTGILSFIIYAIFEVSRK
jgi:hypothetical protein